MSITKDRDGIIWIGTENGLNRFDGYGFRTFTAQLNKAGSVPNGFISQIQPDQKNNLWISTTDGIYYFNTKTYHSKVFKSDPADSGTFRNPHRPIIYLDSTQLPWLFTQDGLYHFKDSTHYERTDKGITYIDYLTNKETHVYSEFVKDRSGSLWCYGDNVIFHINEKTKAFIQAFKCPDQILIRQIYFDNRNRCWVSTWGKGIYRFDPASNQWQPFLPSKERLVVYGAAEWELNGRKTLVFSCSGQRLLLVNEDDLKSSSYTFEEENAALTGEPYVDSQNILWIISRSGVFCTTPSSDLFTVIPVPPVKNDHGKKMPAYVYNMKEEKSGYWIAKRFNGGICNYDRKWHLIKSWSSIPVGPGMKFPGLSSTAGEGYDFKQVGDELFVTTEGGISVLNLHSLKWTAYTPDEIRSAPRLRTIIEENPQTWWIRSFDQGVFIFNPISRKFTRHYLNSDSCTECLRGHMNYLMQDRQNRIFATTTDGLFQYNKSKDRFEKIKMGNGLFPSNVFFGLAEDAEGLLWVGTENGLYALNLKNDQIEKTFLENSKIGIVYRICVDDDQNIWLISNTGYWCWLRKQDKIVFFEYSLGLPYTDGGIFYKTSDGGIYGGGKDAVVRFYPNILMNYKIDAKTKIMEAIVQDSLASFIVNREGQKELYLNPDGNSVNVNFDIINYDLVSANQYYFRVLPGNNIWKQSENGHLSFYGLQPGNYRLEVRGATKLTGKFTNTDSLNITVKKFWYQRDSFKAICILLACSVLFFLVRYRIQTIRKEGIFNQQIAKIEMTALRAQMSPHFIFNSLNSIENFMMQNEKILAIDYLNKFARLIRTILENSRQSVVPIAKDMEAMQLYIDLEKLRFEHKFEYQADIDHLLLTGDYRIPPLLIQPFVENAIIHGIAPSERRDLFLRISVKLLKDHIRYIIEDNGIGRVASLTYRKAK
jgi:ligand-binding sensor domain-containing protein